MRAIWPLAYVAIFVGAGLLGYREMAPERLARVHSSIPSGCAFVFLLTIISYVLALRYAASQCATFPRPSWRRSFPLVDWRYDPLQFFIVLTVIAFGLLIGSLLRLPGSGTNGAWMAVLFSSMFAGELIGLLLGCVIYRSHVRTI